MKKLLIIVALLFICSGCSSTKDFPLSGGNCHFEYKDTFGEHGTASQCFAAKTTNNVQMYCGDDDNIIEVKEIHEVCD